MSRPPAAYEEVFAATRALPTAGVVYIASGAKYSVFALDAARSVQRSNPELGITLLSDQPKLSVEGVVDRHYVFSGGHYRSKVDHLASSPFERTLYLDTDTRVVASLTSAFQLLDRFDLAMAHAHRRHRASTTEVWREEIPDAFPQLNGGVALYRKSPATDNLWHRWSESFHSAGFKKDQVTLRELLWLADDLRWTVLPPEYNIRYRKYPMIWKRDEAEPKILHYHTFHNRHLYAIRKLFGRT